MSLAAFGGALQSVGDAGNQIAEGQLAAHRQKIADLFAALGMQQGQAQLAETEARTKKLGQPVPTETDKYNQSLAAFRQVFKREPSEAEQRTLFGMPEPPKTPAAPRVTNATEAFIRDNPHATAQEIADFSNKNRPDRPDKKVEIKDGLITDADGKTWDTHDPALPQDLQKLVAANAQAKKDEAEQKASAEAKKMAMAF